MNKNLQKNTKDELIEEVIKSRKEIKDLKDKIKDLEWKLNTNTTNSHNSSSSEKINKTTHKCNSRNNWGKKKNRWWQEWHKWKNLERNENVDETIDVSQENCEKCWASLLSNFAKVVKETVRQVIDIPPPSNIVKDYIWKYIKCPECWFLNKPNFPEWITQLVQYGNEVKTRTVYMYNHQTTSYERLSEYFYEIYNLA